MSQLDWVGAPVAPSTTHTIRNTRPSVAEEKAELLLRLGNLINTIPPDIKHGGSIDSVRKWRNDRAAAAKVAGSSRSSVQEITAAISNMGRHFK